MTSKERVKRAIHFQNPDRLPILMFNKDLEEGDIILCDVVEHLGGENRNVSEYGFVWERFDATMGQPKERLIMDLDEVGSFVFPDSKRPGRFNKAYERMVQYGEDKYYIANLFITGFNVMTFLYGFEDTLCDLYTDPQQLEQLADGIFGFEEAVIQEAAGKGFDAVGFFDDWGAQNQLMISPEIWRTFFKPRYKKQFDLCHSLGMDVYFHSCGYVYDIIGDLAEIGVDMMNVSQPNLFDMEQLGREFGGKVCFVCPVSYQTTSISGTREEIFRDVQILKSQLGAQGGGLIGYIEEYSCMGMSDANYQACKDAFFEKTKN